MQSQSLQKIVNEFLSRDAVSIFKELSALSPEEVSLNKMSPDRLSLDRKVLEAIGFSDPVERDNTLLELYKSVIDLIKFRLEKAKSVENRKKVGKQIDIEFYTNELSEIISHEGINPVNTQSFADLAKTIVAKITPDKRMQSKIVNEYWQKIFGSKPDRFQEGLFK